MLRNIPDHAQFNYKNPQFDMLAHHTEITRK